MERHREVTEAMLHHVFASLHEQRVGLEAMLLKPNIVLPGASSGSRASPENVAAATLSCLSRAVPAAVPGIVFLSGGQDDAQATIHLNALNRLDAAPWALSFSFGRALQSSALKAWGGKPENISLAQRALLHRAQCSSAARSGTYSPEMERG